MMRVLWLSMNPGLYGAKGGNDSYNGGGWIGSLLQAFEDTSNIEIGFVFLTSTPTPPKKTRNNIYYPVHAPAPSYFQKICTYYGGYKKNKRAVKEEDILAVIQDFQPDIIHLFGMENEMADILGKVSIPVVVHLQGILSPCDNAFWPVDFSKFDFLWPLTKKEWILRNGFIYAKKSLHARAKHEIDLFKRLQYVMGRTEWDKQCTALMAPKAQYYHVDEILRPVFYEYAGKWQFASKKQIHIITTASNTIYKGLDTILKTAKLLKEFCSAPFVWNVAGLSQDDRMVRFFEQKLKIRSQDVNVQYLGVLTAEELCKEELQASVYVHPSYIDNSPNSLCEAQMLGVPCISTHVGGTASLIESNRNGIIVPANAPYETAYYIKEIATNKEWSEKLSNEGTTSACSRHNKVKIVNELLECYKTIVQFHTI